MASGALRYIPSFSHQLSLTQYPQLTTEWAIPLVNVPACLRKLHDSIYAACARIPRTRRKRAGSALLNIAGTPSMSPTAVSSRATKPSWRARTKRRLEPSDLRKLYPNFDDFVRVLREVNPEGVLWAEYLRRRVFGEEGERVGGNAEGRR
ncbi:hypothetical protein C8F01DRAFT_1251443 [Mycena amicta]|nr:hypothetical protein C8F01DRAFT_1251443 [Mycena amicta]